MPPPHPSLPMNARAGGRLVVARSSLIRITRMNATPLPGHPSPRARRLRAIYRMHKSTNRKRAVRRVGITTTYQSDGYVRTLLEGGVTPPSPAACSAENTICGYLFLQFDLNA
jgi:hypothetical protein